MAVQLTLYYRTGWQSPVLHYGFEGQAWEDATFVAAPEDYGWWKVKVAVKGSKLEFVPRAADKSGWDNAPGGGNYRLEGIPTKESSVAVLRAGEVVLTNLKQQPWALVSDMDGTLIERGRDEIMERFRHFWDTQCRFAVRDGRRLCYLAYNSGRNRMDMLHGCRENDLPRPDFMICGVGTEIYRPAPGAHGTPWYDHPIPPEMDKDWRMRMQEEFGDRDVLAKEVQEEFPTLEVHGGVENDPYRLPCVLRLDLGPPVEELQAWGDKHKTLRVIISGLGDARFVDICSVHADKGLAIQYLLDGNALPLAGDASRIIVAGDSGNDFRMFEVPGVRAVMVGNSQPSLVDAILGDKPDLQQAAARGELPIVVPRPAPLLEVYFSRGHIADGVIEAIRKYYLDEAK